MANGHDISILTISSAVFSVLSLGTLKLASYFGLVSLLSNNSSKSSKLLKNSSVSPLLGLIKKLSVIPELFPNGLPLTFKIIFVFEVGST
jgi:hypothetical protein